MQSFILNSEKSENLEKCTFDYIICMGQLMADASYQILLQHMSETIGFLPPKLGIFEKKIQAALYRQLISFQNELQSGISSKQESLDHFIAEIETDIANFKAVFFEELRGPAIEIVNELESYYHDHFYLNN